MKLAKRKLWRPRYATGEVVHGGAGGFHLPQREERFSYIKPRPKPKRRRRRKTGT
jgi:hypothetical protein